MRNFSLRTETMHTQIVAKAIRGRNVAGLIKEGNKVGILNDNDHRELVRKFRESGDADALHRLLLSNIRLVVKEAAAYRGTDVPLADLVMAGTAGLVIAAERFSLDDRRFNAKFITYAMTWVRQQIGLAAYAESASIRIPMNKLREFRKVRRTLGHERAVEIYSEADPYLLGALGGAMPLDAPPVSGSDDSSDMDILESFSIESLFEDSEPDYESSRELLLSAMSASLTTREAMIMKMYFGMLNDIDGEMSSPEIAPLVGVTPQRVRQIIYAGLKKMNEELRKRGVHSLDLVA